MVEAVTVPNPATPGPVAPVVEPTPVVPDKFKNDDGTINVDELAKSYASLETRMGADAAKDALNKPAGEPKLDADGKPVVEPKLDADGKPVVEDPAKEPAKDDLDEQFKDATYGKVVDDALTAAGLTATGVASEFARDGEVSAGTYDALDKAGFPKSLVDQYVAGAKANMATDEKFIADMQDSVGGEDAYKQMMDWAVTLPKGDVDTFNRLTTSGDPDVVKAAVSALHVRFVDAEGKTGNLVMGGARAGTDVYRSAQEASSAIMAARKTGDPAKIRDVELKMLRSDVFTTK